MTSSISGVLLAAGPSRRFVADHPKQLAPFLGEPLVRRIARTALDSRLRQIIVVVGYRAPTLAAVLAGLAIELVDNCDFASGQSSSVRSGLAHVDPAAAAAVFIPADQPLLTAKLIDRLIDRFESTGQPIVVPFCGGKRGSPVLIARPLFSELATITGDQGGRQLFARHEHEIADLEVSDPIELRDIDSREDYEELLRLGAQRKR